jgi:hypothetical protein
MDQQAAMAAADSAGRRRHYGAFYGETALPGDRPLAVVHGNCQAESLRLVLDATDLATLRIPPVHELTADDLPALRRALTQARLVITQPIRAGYRDLPIGTADVIAATTARTVLIPVVRFAGLYPTQALVRPPADPSLSPPVVPYHDLPTLARAAGRPAPRPPTARGLRAVGEHSIAALRDREQRHGTIVISDLFSRPDFAQMRTINHPGNPVWTALARRVRAAAGLPEAAHDPGRPLLDAIHAPREAAVIDALALDAAPRADWIVDGEPIAHAAVQEAHRRWYETHPETVTAGLSRHRDVLRLLGL